MIFILSSLFCCQGNKWWQTSDEPWQTLACCREIASAVRSADPENYICYYPVQQVCQLLLARLCEEIINEVSVEANVNLNLMIRKS